MSQQVNVALNFSANTQQAKSSLAELQSLLTKIAYGANINVNPGQMQQASSAAKELAFHLNQAYNATTGNFDLLRLNTSLKSAGSSVSQLSSQLLSAGQTGQQAFVKLAQTISMAEAPVARVNGLLGRMATTFGNTLRYQISASAISGFFQAISGAVNYAQELNESLNNIRIVTGYGAASMDKFAREANLAAKALSTTTTEYTNASLIFYQQGLGSEEVKERTEAVIKLANVTGQTAEVVSDQMTAIWNNFDDGSKSLEYYADVITKLGAATASSTDEIAEGLEKFAAISETVGLSYEMATSALATVTAETRQSADVVGTAFKTIFSRMEGLKLGETLDDGTTLNQYSSALMTVGVNIKDHLGNMREMDDILQDLGKRWSTLGQDQQIALAQGVAGIRQYNQFIGLMSNWDKVQQNYDLAIHSQGELNNQAAIYADSWAAAKNEVTASLESIYASVVEDDFFIDLFHSLSTLTDGIGGFLDGIGGIGPVLGAIAASLLMSFSNKIPAALVGLKNNFLITFGAGSKVIQQMNADTQKMIEQGLATGQFNSLQETQLKNAASLSNLKSQMALYEKDMTNAEKQRAEFAIQGVQLQNQEVEKQAEAVMLNREKIGLLSQEFSLTNKVGTSNNTNADVLERLVKTHRRILTEIELEVNESGGLSARYDELIASLGNVEKRMESVSSRVQQFDSLTMGIGQPIINQFQSLVQAGENVNQAVINIDFSQVITKLQGLENTSENAVQKLHKFGIVRDVLTNLIQPLSQGSSEAQAFSAQLKDALILLNDTVATSKGAAGLSTTKGPLSEVIKLLQQFKPSAQDAMLMIGQLGDKGSQLSEVLLQLSKGEITSAEAMDRLAASMKQAQGEIGHTVTSFEALIAISSGLSSVAFGIQSVYSAIQTLKNPDMSGFEKFISVLISASMVLPMLSTGFKSFKAVQQLGAAATLEAAMATEVDTTAKKKNLKTLWAEWQQTRKSNQEKREAALTAFNNAKAAYAEAAAKDKAAQATLKERLRAYEVAIAKQKEAEAKVVSAKAAREEAVNSWASGKMDEKEAMASEAAAIADLAEAQASKAEADAEVQSAAANVAAAQSDAAETSSNLASAGSDLTKSSKGVSTGLKGWGKGIAKLAKSYGGLIIVLAVAAALIYGAIKLYNQKADAAERAAKAAAAAKEQYEQVNQTYSEFTSNLSAYDEAIKGLEDLKKGTLEYQEALIKANEAAIELINSNDLLYGQDYTINEEGLYEITEDGKKKAQQQQLASLQVAQANSLLTAQTANAKQLAVDREKFNRDVAMDGAWGSEDTAWTTGAAGAGAAVGGIIGTVWPGVGNFVGAIVGGAIGLAVGAIGGAIATGIAKNEESDDEIAILDDLAKKYEKQGGITKKDIEDMRAYGYSDALIESLKANFDETEKMVQAVAENTAAIKANVKATTAAANAYNAEYQGLSEEDKELANEIIAREQTDDIINTNSAEYQEAYAHYEDLFSGGDEDAAEAIGKRIYGDDYGTKYKYEDLGGVGWTLKVKNEDGAWETSGDKDSLAQEDLIAQAAQLDLQSYSNDKYLKEIEQINSFADTLTDMNIDSLGVRQIQLDLAAGKETVDLSYLSPEQIAELHSKYDSLGETLGSEHAAAIGRGINNYDVKEYYARLQEQADAVIASGAKELEMTEEALEAYAEHLAETNSSLEGNVKLAAESAVASARMTKSLDKLDEVLAKNIGTVREADTTSMDYFESLGAIKKATEDLLGVEVSSNFITDNLELIDQAAQGSVDALEQLRVKATDDFVKDFLEKMPGLTEAEVNSTLSLWSGLVDQFDDLEPGITLTGQDQFVTDLNNMIATSGMTKDKVNEMLSGMGFSATFSSKPQKIYDSAPTLTTINRKLVNYSGPWDEEYDIVETATSTQGEPTEKEITAFAMETAPPDKQVVPKISSLTPSAPPLASNNRTNSSRAQIKKTNARKKAKDEDVERYYKINNTLSFMDKQLSSIAAKKEMAFGKDKIKLLKEEQKQLEAMLPIQKQYLGQIGSMLNFDQENLVKFGVQFDENGIIANYEEVMRKYRNELLDAQEKYKGDENYDDLIKPFEENYEDLKKYLDQYEETFGLFYDKENEILEAENKLIQQATDIFLEELEQRIEAFDRSIDKIDRRFKLLEFDLKLLEDQEYKAAQAAVIYEDQLLASMERNKKYQEEFLAAQEAYYSIADGYDAEGNEVSQEAIDKAFDDMNEAGMRLLEGSEELLEIEDKIDELLIDHLEEQTDNFADIDKSLEHHISTLDHYSNILELVGKKVNIGGLMGEIREATMQATEVQLKNATAEYELITRELETLKASNATQEEIDAYTEKQREAQNKMLTEAAKALQLAADDYKASMEEAGQAFEKAMLQNSKYDNLEAAQQAFDQQQELNSLYLEEYDKLYQLNKLTRDINKRMTENNSILANKKLSNLLDEINKKKEAGIKLSQYEVDTLQRKYDLQLAEIALEEAKNSKDSMRLRRDAQGNWVYVYTANQEKIDDAQQAYDDALYELEKSSKEYINEMQSYILQNQRDMIEAMSALREEDFASTEDYERALEEIRRYYSEKNRYYYEQLGIAIDDVNESYDEQIIVFNDLALAEVTGIQSIEEGIKTFNTNVDNYLISARTSFETYKNKQEELTGIIGSNFSNLATNIKNAISGEDGIVEQVKKLEKAAQDTASSAEAAFNKVFSAVEEFRKKYSEEIDNIIAKNRELAEQVATDDLKIIAAGSSYDGYSVIQIADSEGNKNWYYGWSIPTHGDVGDTITSEQMSNAIKMDDNDLMKKIDLSGLENIETPQYEPPPDDGEGEQGEGGETFGKGSGNEPPPKVTVPEPASSYVISQSDLALKHGTSSSNPFHYQYTKSGGSSIRSYPNGARTPKSSSAWDGAKLIENVNPDYFLTDAVNGTDPLVGNSIIGYTQVKLNNGNTETIFKLNSPIALISGSNRTGTSTQWINETDLRQLTNLNISSLLDKTKYNLEKFDTGGYTGEWGPEGKMAVLHEKELVLNKDQTSDFLQSLEFMTQIVDTIDRNSKLAVAGLAVDGASPAAVNEKVVQQTVSIDATFPGVTSAIEIEEALNNIINDAVQYASINNR